MTDNQVVAREAARVARNFIRNANYRRYSIFNQAGQAKSRTLELDLIKIGDRDWFRVTSWGYDYEEFRIPLSRPELIRRKMLLQMNQNKNGADKVFLSYCFQVLKAVDSMRA